MSSKSFDKSTREWVQIRKKLYLQIKSEVHRLLANTWKEFLPLEKKYAAELAQTWRSVNKEVLYEDLTQSDVILLGDFHALQQSQRGHLRILREWPDPSQLVLAVEFFQARHQKYLLQFMKGKLSEETFLKKISWEKSWSFPWEHYRPIVEWAKKNGVPVIGINWSLRQTRGHSISIRENFSAITLRKVQKRFPTRKLIVIYGDLHLSKTQLPLALKRQDCFRRAKIRRVFQNYEPLYFEALNQGIESKIELIQFRNGDFCIQSVPPWVKWQSYLLFLENTFDRQIDELEGDIDHTDHVAKLVAFLAEEFKLKTRNSTLAVYTANDTRVYSKIRHTLPRREWLVVQRWISEERSFYIPELEFGYLGRVTVNHTATLAGEYMHALLSKRKKLYFTGKRDFERQIWIQCMAYLGSKVINHKRKTNSIDGLRKLLLSGDAREGHRKILLLALHQKVRELSYLATGKLLSLKNNYGDDNAYVDAARLLGAMLGEKVYTLYQTKIWSLLDLLKLMRMPIEGDAFKAKYYKVLAVIARCERR